MADDDVAAPPPDAPADQPADAPPPAGEPAAPPPVPEAAAPEAAAPEAAAPDTAAPPPASTPEQDSWLHQTLGLDLSRYVDGAAAALSSAAAAIAPALGAAGGGVRAEPDAGSPSDAGGGAGGGSFASRIADAAGSLVEKAKVAVQTAVDAGAAAAEGVGKLLSGPPPVPRADLGSAQTARADKKLDALPPEDQTKVRALIDGAAPDEKKYLLKALASNHSPAELEAFYQEIQGKNAAWMDEHLHLTGQPDGTGIKQQWKDSCGPTTVQAMRGELDPVYALRMRQNNTDIADVDEDDGTAMNPQMAEEQRNALEYFGGLAVARDSPRDGKGMVLDDELNAQKATTGLQFDCQFVTKANADAELAKIDQSVGNGLPVPLRLGNSAGGHFVLITGADPGPPRRYSIHDPWDGKLVTVTDQQIKDGKFNIANYSQVTHVYTPAPVPEAVPNASVPPPNTSGGTP